MTMLINCFLYVTMLLFLTIVTPFDLIFSTIDSLVFVQSFHHNFIKNLLKIGLTYLHFYCQSYSRYAYDLCLNNNDNIFIQ